VPAQNKNTGIWRNESSTSPPLRSFAIAKQAIVKIEFITIKTVATLNVDGNRRRIPPAPKRTAQVRMPQTGMFTLP